MAGEFVEEVERSAPRVRTLPPLDRDPWSQHFLPMALRLLASRALVWVAVLGMGALWTYTVIDPQPWRISACVAACTFTLLPVLIRDAKGAS